MKNRFVDMVKSKMPALVITFIFFGLIVSAAGCGADNAWPVYVNKNYTYSIEYPRGWTVSEPFQNKQMVVIKSPDERDTISVLVNENKGLTLEQQVNYFINLTRQGSYYYKLVSSEKTQHQGIEARLLVIAFQSQKDSPILNVRELYLISSNRFYLMRFSTKFGDLTSLSELYNHVFNSFKLTR